MLTIEELGAILENNEYKSNLPCLSIDINTVFEDGTTLTERHLPCFARIKAIYIECAKKEKKVSTLSFQITNKSKFVDADTSSVERWYNICIKYNCIPKKLLVRKDSSISLAKDICRNGLTLDMRRPEWNKMLLFLCLNSFRYCFEYSYLIPVFYKLYDAGVYFYTAMYLTATLQKTCHHAFLPYTAASGIYVKKSKLDALAPLRLKMVTDLLLKGSPLDDTTSRNYWDAEGTLESAFQAPIEIDMEYWMLNPRLEKAIMNNSSADISRIVDGMYAIRRHTGSSSINPEESTKKERR